MPKVTMLRGLPASGKSTMSHGIVKKTGNSFRVNKDDIRKMLFGDTKWTYNKEKLTRSVEYDTAKAILDSGYNVVVDDTNLNEKSEILWRDFSKSNGAKFDIIDIDTPLNECLIREHKRQTVGASVIWEMALRHHYYDNGGKDVVLFDIDGTLANIDHRIKYLNGKEKNWEKFFNEMVHDTPREEIIEKYHEELDNGNDVFIVSGRPETYREETMNWLRDNGILTSKVLMRKRHDKRPDTDVKQNILNAFIKGGFNIKRVYDDRPCVIRMWIDNGINVIDVGDGKEF